MAHNRPAVVMKATSSVVRHRRSLYRVQRERVVSVYVWGPHGNRWASCDGRVYRMTASAGRTRDTEHRLVAPMPSVVLKVFAIPGMTVAKGDVLVLLEAMKMETTIKAPADATISAVHCREGERVQPEAVLIEFDDA